ncbi:lipopolysaccharide assembly protein LapA domain-containing protein [Gluconacetobacter tumulisoli]|uniref:LapA family protein n=1 Tax=Gluconacetobacter tumulisoli TaxID=1286189 RepID=A0A7W4PL66_9PROT|nr:LapA family protein [Gluconacetobacter tumulisoli]MBB2201865.1 LapA family protein [Gluconacetobacter tumulisoli]
MLRLLITIPFLLALIVFSACNQDSIQMWFLDWGWKSSVGVLTLIVAAFFFALGALSLWFAELRQRGRARRAEQQIRTLEEQIAELRRQQAETFNPPAVPPPAPPAAPYRDVLPR